MHELGIVFHIIDAVEKVGAENALTSVSSVTMEVGEVSAVISSYLQDCWQWAVKRSDLLDGAKLIIETMPARTVCNHCKKTYGTVAYGRICPFCESADTVLLTGNEISIKEIETPD